MCAVFGQSFTEPFVCTRVWTDERDNAMPFITLASIQGAVSDGDTANVSHRFTLTLSRYTCCSKGWEFVRVCEWVCRWGDMVVPPFNLEPLSGLGRDGWTEKDPEIQVSACFSSVQSSEKGKKKIHVVKLYLCSNKWGGTISKTQCCNYVFYHYISKEGLLCASTRAGKWRNRVFLNNKHPGAANESQAWISHCTSAKVPPSEMKTTGPTNCPRTDPTSHASWTGSDLKTPPVKLAGYTW